MNRMKVVLYLLIVFTMSTGVRAQIEPLRNSDHRRHHFRYGNRFETELPAENRFSTSRTSKVVLPLPKEDDRSFTFVVFGDRTSGQDRHVSVLADAVHDVNLIEPDFVMNVGDMVQGYNATELWTRQMLEYKEIMNELKCPWFPTAGNHDVYWGGSDRPKFQHEENFETHFGPLWYAFRYKNCWFVVLFTDEGNRETGEKNFTKPELQKMTEEQFQWLKGILEKAKDADHVFLFQHQPRWQNYGRYGDDWDRVHRLLVEAGNVKAVFAGHTHFMSYENKDGIEYFMLSTTGGNIPRGGVPRLGYQDNYVLLNVRKDRYGLAAIPVSAAIDPRELNRPLLDEIRKLQELRFAATTPALSVGADGAVNGKTAFELTNTTSVPLDVVARLESKDSRWEWTDYPQKARLEPGEKKTFDFSVKRPDRSFDKGFREPVLRLDMTALLPGMAVPIPAIEVAVPLDMDAALEKHRIGEQAVLKLSHTNDRLTLPSVKLEANTPFTLEGWFRPVSTKGKIYLFSKGRDRNEVSLFLEDGVPCFQVPLDGFRLIVRAPETVNVEPGRWHHLAGVFENGEGRLYLDGKTVASKKHDTRFPANAFGATLGAALDANGEACFGFTGAIDSVRISQAARYGNEGFQPKRDFEVDGETLLLLDMQRDAGRLIPVPGRSYTYGILEGDAEVVPEASLN